MHDHDHELILDLVSERGLAEGDIAAQLEDCLECLADVSEQRAMVDMLSALEAPRLTDSERTALHEAVTSELADRTVIQLPTRRLEWTRIGAVAAAFAGVVVVAGLLTTIGGGGDDTAADGDDATFAAETARVDEASPESAGATASDSAEMADAAPAEPAAEEMENDTAADDSIAVAPPSDLVIVLGEVAVDEFSERVLATLEDVIDRTEGSGVLTYSVNGLAVCFPELDGDRPVWAVVTGTVDGAELEAYIYRDGEFVVFESEGCEPTELP